MKATTTRHIARSLRAAVASGHVSSAVIVLLRNQLLDATMGMHIDAEETGDRIAMRRADSLGELADELDEAFADFHCKNTLAVSGPINESTAGSLRNETETKRN